MIAEVREGINYINVSIGITDSNGEPVEPDSAWAYFFKLDQNSGTLFPDPALGNNGTFTLEKQFNIKGFFGTSIYVGTLPSAQYTLLFRALYNNMETISVETLFLDQSKKKIFEISDSLDSLGSMTKRILGLTQENFKIYDQQYENNYLTSCKIRIYESKDDLELDQNEIAEYHMSATYDNGNCIHYQVTRI